MALPIVACVLFVLLLGVAIYAARQRTTLLQLERLLLLLPDYGSDREISLPMVARFRRAITATQHHTQQLADELEIWRELLDAAPIGYLQVDADNHLLFCNAQARTWLGLERWHPEQMRLLLEVARSLELDRLVERTRNERSLQEAEWVFHRSVAFDGGPRRSQGIALRGRGCPLPGRSVGVFLENQQFLADLTEVQDRTFAELAHELRTPLTSIRLVSETLQGRLAGTERQWVERMLAEANRLIHLIEDWLDLAQLQKNPSQVLRREPIDLQTLAVTVWQTLEPLAARKQLALNYQAQNNGSSAPALTGDRQRLMQVFLNLFDNAIAHSPIDGEIRVLVRGEPATQPTRVIIDTIDFGPGFSEADLEHIFERLYRGSPSRQQEVGTTARPGTGLGLSIVQQIVRAHGGTITAKNHPETGGAWLQIALPISPNPNVGESTD